MGDYQAMLAAVIVIVVDITTIFIIIITIIDTINIITTITITTITITITNTSPMESESSGMGLRVYTLNLCHKQFLHCHWSLISICKSHWPRRCFNISSFRISLFLSLIHQVTWKTLPSYNFCFLEEYPETV